MGAPHFVGGASEIKGWATRPNLKLPDTKYLSTPEIFSVKDLSISRCPERIKAEVMHYSALAGWAHGVRWDNATDRHVEGWLTHPSSIQLSATDSSNPA